MREFERMKIGVDIDNVLANTFDELSSHFNRFMGKEYAADETLLEARLKLSEEELIDL